MGSEMCIRDRVEATRKSIDAAAKRFEQVDVRTRAIQRRLRTVQELPSAASDEATAALALAAHATNTHAATAALDDE